MRTQAQEILISGTDVKTGTKYEFIINPLLQVTACMRCSEGQTIDLCRRLFNLDHVRVDPTLDNNRVIQSLLQTFKAINAKVINTPDTNSVSICFRPLGKIQSQVRFYINDKAKMTFLCPDARPKLISTKFRY